MSSILSRVEAVKRERRAGRCYGRDRAMGGRVAGVLQWLQHPESGHGVAVLLTCQWHSSGDALFALLCLHLSCHSVSCCRDIRPSEVT